MTTDISVQSNLRPVSFEKNKGLTKGQQAIYDILVKKATAGEILTRDEIVDLYLEVEPRYYQRHIGWEPGEGWISKTESTALTKQENYYAVPRAMQWFKNNLATCIIKGKILAIPVIEDNE